MADEQHQSMVKNLISRAEQQTNAVACCCVPKLAKLPYVQLNLQFHEHQELHSFMSIMSLPLCVWLLNLL